jgi:membrane-bound metal-dependent hydrolase YbcI (DUF457 family)
VWYIGCVPTPIGHGLAAVAAGWAIARPAGERRVLLVQAAAFAALGTMPDLDLLFAQHRGVSHSVGVAAIAATIVLLLRVPLAETRARLWLAAFAAWATHPLLDSLALDTAAPIGIMAFWPFSAEYVQSGLEVFKPVSRSVGAPSFLPTLRIALTRELLILVPLTAAVWLWRTQSRAARVPRSPRRG